MLDQSQTETLSPQFESGDRVRLRLHPQWIGTVKYRSLGKVITVQWDNGGVQMIDGSLLILADKNK